MSIFSDIKTAMAADPPVQYFADIAPEGTRPPFVVGRRTLFERVQVMQGAEGLQHSDFTFLCVGKTTDTTRAKEDALALAATVRAKIEACKTTTLRDQYEVQVPGDEFDDEALMDMEPVAFSFWHQA